MSVVYSLTSELRIRLKAPIGMLIQGSFAETMKTLQGMINKEKPAAIISVGDTVSKNLAENHILPHLAIIDNRVMRRNIQPIPLKAKKTICVKNPPGTITEEASRAIQEALSCGFSVKIVVNGEEDLLALIAVLYSPENSYVIYGQPHEGIVVIKATSEKKAEVTEILKAMESSRKAK